MSYEPNTGYLPRKFYKIVRGSDTQVANELARIANIVGDCKGGTVYDTPMATTSDTESKILLRFAIPAMSVDKFLKESGW